jgi:hypothetical protein
VGQAEAMAARTAASSFTTPLAKDVTDWIGLFDPGVEFRLGFLVDHCVEGGNDGAL